MTAIVDIIGREILDSRGNPTVEVDVVLADGSRGRAAVPSGASTGTHEAVELRDGDKKRYLGKGVRNAVEAVNGEIFDALSGMDAEAQVKIDETMIALDGTPNKGRLGANAILGVSLAVAKAAAAAKRLPLYRYVGGTAARLLPVPMMNIINGGVHADNPIDFQEFMIVPLGAPSFAEALRAGTGNLPHAARGAQSRRPQYQCRRRGRLRAQSAVGRGGAGPCRGGDREGRIPRRRRCHARARSRRRANSSSDGAYRYEGEGKTRSVAQQVDYLADLGEALSDRVDRGRHGRGRLRRLEAADAEDSASSCQLVGDDIFVTNVARLTDGIKNGIANSILIKVNQIGTLTETLAAVETAHKAGYTAVMSHRSGETEDFDHRRPRGRDQLRADQDRLARPRRPHREIQSAAAHRGGTRRAGALCRARGLQGARLARWLAAACPGLAIGAIPKSCVNIRPTGKVLAMDQTIDLKAGDRRLAMERLRDFIVASVDQRPRTTRRLRIWRSSAYFPKTSTLQCSPICPKLPTTGRCTAAPRATILLTAPTRG